MAIERGNPTSVKRLTTPAILCSISLDASSGAPMQNDTVTGFLRASPWAYFQDDGEAFVTHQVGQEAIRTLDPINFT